MNKDNTQNTQDAGEPSPADNTERVPHAPLARTPRESLVRLTHVIYALHACAVVVGLIGATTIAGAFVFGLPSLLAVFLNYFKRAEVEGTWLDYHFAWQIRTFWFTALWLVVYFLLAFTIIGIPLAILLISVLGIWVLYRVVRGWLALNEERPVRAWGADRRNA